MERYYELSVEEVLTALKSSLNGLDHQEVEKRQRTTGLNRIDPPPPLSVWRILLSQFTNFIIYLLLFAVLFSIIIGEYADSLVILAILIMNSIIGFAQEYRANRSLEALKNMSRINARVTRSGVTTEVDARELVYGDIIELENGDKIPADCRILHTTELQIEESPLTGESEPVTKCVEALRGKRTLAEQHNMAFSATTVVGGRGLAVVTSCGMKTEIGRISQLIAETEENKTPLQVRLDRFGRNLGFIIIAICLVVFTMLIGRFAVSSESLNRYVLLQFAFIAISLAVAAVPTALPAVVTIALSIGTRKLLAKNMLVRRLNSVETLGDCDVICSDKTGTLTRNQMTVIRAWTLEEEFRVTSTPEPPSKQDSCLTTLFQAGIFCNNSVKQFHNHAGGNPTEIALLEAADKLGIKAFGKRVKEKPFDSNRKCMSVLIDQKNGTRLYTKGAPDHVLDKCEYVLTGTDTEPMTEAYREKIIDAYQRFGAEAMRVIALACKENDNQENIEESSLTFIGLQAMIDPPRDDVADSIRRAKQAHIRAIMITGDHKATACAVAKNIGITGDCLTGQELDSLSDEELSERLITTNIFARVIPEHKQRIVSCLQQHGHTVAMTGDGVNDAPALKKADIGIAVGSGTDVAREASDFVLLDDSFTSIVDGVEEGRGIYENIQKSIMLLLSGNLMEVLIIFLAVLMDFNLPLTALLLLWINLITDGAPALAYSVDPYGINIMQRPPIPMGESILPAVKLKLLLILGIAGTVIGLALFHFSGGNSNDEATYIQAQTMIFNFVVLYEMILVFVIRHNYKVRLFTNIWLWSAVIFSILVQGIIIYTPLRDLFHVVPLGGKAVLELFAATGVFALICFAAATFFDQSSAKSVH